MKPITPAIALMLLLVAITYAAAPDPKSSSRKIPLDSIYSTSHQKDFKKAEDAAAPEVAGDFPAVPTILAFAWAKDIKHLTKETLIPAKTATAKDPQELTKPADDAELLWAVITLGSTGSTPPQLILDSVTVTKDGSIEIAYHQNQGGISTMDMFPYIYWIPLGKPAAGKNAIRVVTGGKTVAEQNYTITEKPAATQK